MKAFKIRFLIIALVILGIIAGTAVPALAVSQGNSGTNASAMAGPGERGKGDKSDKDGKEASEGKLPGRLHEIKGQVKEVAGNKITLIGGREILVDRDTKYHKPGKEDATLADVAPGTFIAAQLTKTDAGLLAKRIMIMPRVEPAPVHTGKVTAFTAGSSITIEGKDGKTATYSINAETKFVFPKGVTAVAKGDIVSIAGKKATDGSLVARVITVHRERPDAESKTIKGKVTAIGADSLTIKPAEGDEVKVKFGSNTIFLIKGSPALAFGADVVVLAKVNEDGSLLAKVVNAGVKRPAISKLPKPRPLAG